MSEAALAAWLAEAGLRNLPFDEMVNGFSQRLNALGVPVARTFAGMNTLHPLVRMRSMIWERSSGPNVHFEFRHVDIDAPVLRQSPFLPMLLNGVAERRCRVDDPVAVRGVPVFEELHAAGMTEWFGRMFPFGALAPAFKELAPGVGDPDSAEHVERQFFACALTTDRPGGYSDDDLATLNRLLPLFALAVKAVTAGAVGHDLLAAYLGDDPASRVYAGTVLRRGVQSVEAVLFYTDLRGFTALADVTPGPELIALLDDCFECMVEPVAHHGGEVLKFLGDGLLAAFAVIAGNRDAVCGAALDAAVAAQARIAALNARRRSEGRQAIELDISLHIGTVQYGNVGTATRLDFTVIGPAVNEASRIEQLCEPLGRPVLASQQFAKAAVSSRSRLVSLGRHQLRGVREPTELFALAGA
jgi:adenylate cyclase